MHKNAFKIYRQCNDKQINEIKVSTISALLHANKSEKEILFYFSISYAILSKAKKRAKCYEVTRNLKTITVILNIVTILHIYIRLIIW